MRIVHEAKRLTRYCIPLLEHLTGVYLYLPAGPWNSDADDRRRREHEAPPTRETAADGSWNTCTPITSVRSANQQEDEQNKAGASRLGTLQLGTVAVCRSGRGQVSPAGQFLLLLQLLLPLKDNYANQQLKAKILCPTLNPAQTRRLIQKGFLLVFQGRRMTLRP